MSLCSPPVSSGRGDTLREKWCGRVYCCDVCSAKCNSAKTLVEHFLGNKHKRKLQSTEAQKQNDGLCLSYFLKAHMKEEPIVGLEYVMEVRKDSSYEYSCQLCKVVNADLPFIVAHITDSFHTERYIRERFANLLPSSRDKVREREYVKGLKDAAVMILKQQGKKEIQVVLPESDGKTRGASEDIPPSKPESDGKIRGASEDIPPSKPESDGKTREASEDTPPSKPESDGKTRGASEDTPPSKPESDGKTREAVKDAPPSKHKSGNRSHSKLSPLPYQETSLDESRESYRYNKMFQKSIRDDPPLAKRSRHSPDCERDALPSTSHISKHRSSHYNKRHAVRMDCTATQQLEFRTNEDFLEYLANFVISDDEDVSFIQTIRQNCIKALASFQEEEAERQKTGHQPEASLEDTSRTAQKIPGILEDETESHLSDSKTTLLKNNSNPPSDAIPKNEATALFFNSIKDMDESEVVGVFQKLAATNPEFQEMNIPSVIRFLKYSGRLKKP